MNSADENLEKYLWLIIEGNTSNWRKTSILKFSLIPIVNLGFSKSLVLTEFIDNHNVWITYILMSMKWFAWKFLHGSTSFLYRNERL